MILLLAIIWNSLQAMIEALIEMFNKDLSKFIRKIHLLLVALIFSMWFVMVKGMSEVPLWQLLTGFIFVRFAIYDLIWNGTAKVCGADIPITYYGKTKLYDRVMTKLASFGWWLKLCAGIVGTSFLLNLNKLLHG